MYISRIHLCNWRSYGDAEFTFERPSGRRPLVLVGAMNGHGKTSLLFALYVGLFGRHGLRHAEGFQFFNDEDIPHYREAIRKFRRTASESDEPTSVEIVFSPTPSEVNTPEIRIVRRWFFASSGQPRQGDGFETVDLYIDGKAQRLHLGVDAAVTRLERFLFRADVMPAFFFDGEQAQTLINNSGQDGMKKAVEVLFGTKVVEEALDEVKQFVQQSHSKLGGKKNTSTQQTQLDERVQCREKLEKESSAFEQQITELEKLRKQKESERQRTQESLTLKGGERKADLVQTHADVEKAETERRNAEKSLTECVNKLGLALAMSRLAPAITNRLNAEAALERWEGLRDGTINRTNEVLSIALPEPPESDPLLGNLSLTVRQKVRDRFQIAIQHIYNPPPTDCASAYILGHVRGQSRDRLLLAVSAAKSQGIDDIRSRTRRLAEARLRQEDAKHRLGRIGNLPVEVEELSSKLRELGEQTSETSRQLGAVENEAKKRRADLKDVNAEIGRLQEALAKLGPEQRRIAVAERMRSVLSSLNEQLRPITVARLQDSVTTHFTRVADRRYQGGKIVFPDNGSPILRRSNHPDEVLSVDFHCGHITAHLNQRWPFGEGEIGVFRAHDASKHLRAPIHSMQETHRCLIPPRLVPDTHSQHRRTWRIPRPIPRFILEFQLLLVPYQP